MSTTSTTSTTTNRASALRVISLLRVSTDDQDTKRQRADQQRSQSKFGLDIARTVELVGVSGTATLDDTQVQQILREIENPEIDGIHVSSLDRLFRPGKRYGQFAILDKFVDAKKRIWSTREGMIDPDTDEGYDKCLSAGGRAGAEWRELRRRTGDGKRETAEAGFIPHGNAKFGWDIIGRKQTGVVRQGQAVLNEREAPIAREMFERRAAGEATYAIAKWLNKEGIRNKRGTNGQAAKQWSRTTVLQILRSTDFIGKHMWQGIEIPIPRIVSDELFYAVQARMGESKKKWSGRPSTRYRLRAYLYCQVCGHRCVGIRNGRSQLAYRCGHRSNQPPVKQLCPARQVSAELIERVAWDAIWGLLKSPQLLLKMGQHFYDAQAKPPESDLGQIEQDINRLRQIERNLGILIQDALSDNEANTHRTKRNETRSKIAALDLELRTTERTNTLPPLRMVEAAVSRITARPEPSTYEEQRDIMDHIIDLRMQYADGELTIGGKVPIAQPSDDDGGNVFNVTVQNCYSGVHGASSFVHAIPFVINTRVA